MKPLQTESLDRQMEVISDLETKEECFRFFEDLCTVKELLDMAQRLDVAIMLRKGANYQTIAQQVNVSTATISRVSRCLNYGAGGYAEAIKKLKED